METANSKTLDTSQYSYAYNELKEKLISGTTSNWIIEEVQPSYNKIVNIDEFTYDDVLKHLKEDLLPFFESIFNVSVFDAFVNSSKDEERSICDTLRQEYINFIHVEVNKIAKYLNDFRRDNQVFYNSFFQLQETLSKRIFKYVFKNSEFNGQSNYYALHGDSNQFLKIYLNEVLIAVRDRPMMISSGHIEFEINRMHKLILKNSNFSCLHWYHSELKSGLADLKFFYKRQSKYGLICSELILRRLYRELERYEFIDIEYTTENDFVKVFLYDWNGHDSVCVLKMDNPQTKYFLDQFKIHIDSKLKLSDIEKAKNITNKSGYINSSSLSASSSRNKFLGPKREDDLVALFKKA